MKSYLLLSLIPLLLTVPISGSAQQMFEFNEKIQCPSMNEYELISDKTSSGVNNIHSFKPSKSASVYVEIPSSAWLKIPNNFKAHGFYNDGSVVEIIPIDFDFKIPLMNNDSMINKIMISGDNYKISEKLVDCKLSESAQKVMIKQFEEQQVFDAKAKIAQNYCNELIYGCKVRYDINYQLNAPNDYVKKLWSEGNELLNYKKAEYTFGYNQGFSYNYYGKFITKDDQTVENRGTDYFEIGKIFIYPFGKYDRSDSVYQYETTRLNIAGYDRSVVYFSHVYDPGIGTLGDLFYQEEHYYDFKTGLLLKSEVNRELLDVSGVRNTEKIIFSASYLNFPKDDDSFGLSGAGGGCLIATATFDSELAPQVQKLREIRDSKLLSTESGSQFMESFNSFYYSFSPYIADYERENPVFKEIVKIGITPMLSTLSLMDYADTESEVLGIGISLIILNAMMYVGLPVFGIMRLRK